MAKPRDAQALLPHAGSVGVEDGGALGALLGRLYDQIGRPALDDGGNQHNVHEDDHFTLTHPDLPRWRASPASAPCAHQPTARTVMIGPAEQRADAEAFRRPDRPPRPMPSARKERHGDRTGGNAGAVPGEIDVLLPHQGREAEGDESTLPPAGRRAADQRECGPRRLPPEADAKGRRRGSAGASWKAPSEKILDSTAHGIEGGFGDGGAITDAEGKNHGHGKPQPTGIEGGAPLSRCGENAHGTLVPGLVSQFHETGRGRD